MAVLGNRGKCAQPCRLPYELLEDDKKLEQGHLLSPKDVCSLELLPKFIESGVTSFKIEGRMKTPEYVATVTRIYRNYIDLYLQGKPYEVDPKDKKDLLQVFNRGGFSTGHLSSEANRDLVFKEKPNNMGIYLGNVLHYNANKGHIKLELKDDLSIGDTITFEKEPSRYRVSELMINERNVPIATIGDMVKMGRMKGMISPGHKIYKLESKALMEKAQESFAEKNRKKIQLDAFIQIKKGMPVSLKLETIDINPISISITSGIIPEEAQNLPITSERIQQQLNKTGNTPFSFRNITVDLEDNLYLSPISSLNELRRNALTLIEEKIKKSYQRDSVTLLSIETPKERTAPISPEISVLLEKLDHQIDYTVLSGINRIYLPLKHFINPSYQESIQKITDAFPTYLYLPIIIKDNFKNVVKDTIKKAISSYPIKGFVISHFSQLALLEEWKEYPMIANYSMNIFNNQTSSILSSFERITLSPELNKQDLSTISCLDTIKKEVIVYGRMPLMHSNYCLLGHTNHCYAACDRKCNHSHHYFLKDRLGMQFPILPDSMQTITTIYNSKITSISPSGLSSDSVRIDFLEESLTEMQSILSTIKEGNRMEGKEYTNGNLNRDI